MCGFLDHGDVLVNGEADVISQIVGDRAGGDEFKAALEGGSAANLGQIFGKRFIDHGWLASISVL
mgnify:CR=1 FL=1